MRTQLVGILNLTPDSFSDGGNYTSVQQAVQHARKLVADGADIIDVGAESTRPGATPISAEEEWARLQPVLLPLLSELQGQVEVSIDTRHPETARHAIAAGVHWINDVSGLPLPMIDAVKDSAAKLVLMHALSVPADSALTLPTRLDPVVEVRHFFEARLEVLEKAGVARGRMVLDPGIGFGKTPAQSWALCERIAELKTLGLPLLVGHSRKSFLGAGDRDSATLEMSHSLIAHGVDYLRVHDVAAHKALL